MFQPSIPVAGHQPDDAPAGATETVFVARPVKANRGDLASQMGLVQGVLAVDAVATVYVSTYYPHHYAGLSRVVPLPPAPLRGYALNRQERRVLDAGPLVLWGGGVDLQDCGSKLKLCVLWLRLTLIKRCGVNIVLTCQGAGPLRSRAGRALAGRIVQRLDGAIVREPTARRLLIEVGGISSARIECACDGAFMLDPPDCVFGRAYLTRKGFDLGRPILGVNIRRWYHERGGWIPSACRGRWAGHRLPVPMTCLLDHLAQAIAGQTVASQIVLLPMYRREPEPWEDDIVLLAGLQSRLPSDFHFTMVDEDVVTPQLLSIIAGCSAMVGVRLHSTILAHLAGVPALHIAYDHKGVEHFQMMNMEPWCVPIDEIQASGGADLLRRKLEYLLAQRTALAETVSSRVTVLRADARQKLHDVIREVRYG